MFLFSKNILTFFLLIHIKAASVWLLAYLLTGFDRYKALLEKILALSLHYFIRAGVDLRFAGFC